MKASNIISKLESLQGELLTPKIEDEEIIFVIENLTEPNSIAEWAKISQEYEEKLDATATSVGYEPHIDYAIRIPKEDVDIDIRKELEE